ncbi:4-hydroxy-tetrahydrodipicolinate synthase [Sphaerochaeta sp. PS]|uniref:4-hydroxy-tetrahydrodipicolinate synthase n=1 Tax=Sphaerochaeta sp. PS TaxID=3076336 RepID=UPI0028A35D96|nr:4-hydroxy-tetrahydrodipicolinate synthase [Sphaerochaeta sp. PS]MDT4762714.1 4-hydroxy-tetrahydrodipicolinate synthase [Sphaerochaeta sp. PS]
MYKNFVPRGIIPALVTPLKNSEEVDLVSLRKLIRYQLDNGVHGIFVIGSTGEFYALSMEEKQKLIEATVDEVAGKIPVYAGTNDITTRESIQLTKMAERCGVDAVSVLTPMFISPSPKELYTHYKAIAESTDLPIILYNNSPRTGVGIPVDTCVKLATDCQNIIGIKDSSGDFTLTGEYIRRTRHLSHFHVLQGRDTQILAGFVYGATGAIAACANVAPAIVVDIYEKYMQGDLQGALEAQYALAPLRLAFSLGTFPSVIKEALHMIGIPAGITTAPCGPLTDEERAQLQKVLLGMGLLA